MNSLYCYVCQRATLHEYDVRRKVNVCMDCKTKEFYKQATAARTTADLDRPQNTRKELI